MDNHHLRSVILELEKRLSDDDRNRLHFFLGNDVPRRIRDDASLRGTLSLMESLFDQDKINEQDFTLLIHAFDEIQCIDAAQLLREHMKRTQSIQSLVSIMPLNTEQSIEVQDEDKYTIGNPLIVATHSIEMIPFNEKNINSVSEIIDNQSLQSNHKKFRRKINLKYLLLLFILILSFSGLAILINLIINNSHQFKKELTIKQKNIIEEKLKYNQLLKQLHYYQSNDNYTIFNLTNQLNQSIINEKIIIKDFKNLQLKTNKQIENLTNQFEQLYKKYQKQNETIQQYKTNQIKDKEILEYFQLSTNKTIENLTIHLQQLLNEQIDNNQKQQELIDQRNKFFKELIKQNQTIEYLNNQLNINTKSTQINATTTTQILNEFLTSTRPSSTTKLNTGWKQHGIVVAEGDAKQSLYPLGFDIDDDQSLVVVDYLNHRVLEFNNEIKINGQLIAGGNGKGNRIDQLNYPTDIIIDKEENKLFICDRENKRIVRWSRYNGKYGEIIISNIKCFSLTMDYERFIYVSDIEKHEIKRWHIGDIQGILVAGGNGKGNYLNQLNTPHYIFVDHEQTIFISDMQNRRIIKWIKNAKEGLIVIDGNDNNKENIVTKLISFEGIFIDQLGTIFVADCLNNRIISWTKEEKQGILVVGNENSGNKLNELNCPMDISFDLEGNLYVADYNNNRILKFEINKIKD